ncbi:MAG: C1 family peptidase [Bacteroidia bacterium]|nr:C1 family peptidase [Bacteroidia bacterium]
MKKVFFIIVFLVFSAPAQNKTFKPEGTGYEFTILKWLDALPPEDQRRTNTCWSFSGLSFLESEIMRTGKAKNIRLSKMFIVRHTYPMKAANYLRMHGKTNLAEGGGFPDVLEVIKKYGIVPESAYPGFTDSVFLKSHRELEAAIQHLLKPVAESEGPIPFDFYIKAVEQLCDLYLGKVPESFEFEGKRFTPKQFAEYLGIKPENYVLLTSFTHHPANTSFVLEVPDNWLWARAYNLSLDDFRKTMRLAIENNFTFAWAADVSEKTFLYKHGLALWPQNPLPPDELIKKPVPQKPVSPQERQKEFDNYTTQDDHGMHIIGTAVDQNKNFYYVVKNSWGGKHNNCEGYFYASEEYVLMKTTSIMLHKDALPAEIRKKLNL